MMGMGGGGEEGVSKHKIIKEKDSLYVFILAYNESLFFE